MRTRNSEQEDSLLRIIQQLAAAAKRMRELLTRTADESATVRREAGASIALLLGPEHAMLARLDPESAVRLVQTPARIELWIELLELDAAALERGGFATQAQERRARARALRTAAIL